LLVALALSLCFFELGSARRRKKERVTKKVSAKKPPSVEKLRQGFDENLAKVSELVGDAATNPSEMSADKLTQFMKSLKAALAYTKENPEELNKIFKAIEEMFAKMKQSEA
jgi:methyl-accepting chemotaxis protein